MSGECVYDLVDSEPQDAPVMEVAARNKTWVKKGNRAPPPTGSTFGFQGTSAVVSNLGGEHTEPSAHPAKKPIGEMGREVGPTVQPSDFLKKNAGPYTASRGAPTVNLTKFRKSDWHREKVKPDIPKEPPVLGMKTDKNFVVANAVENILAIPTKNIPAAEPRPTERKDFGKVPNYLKEIKEDIQSRRNVIQAYNHQMRAANERWSELTREELEELRMGLQRRWDSLNKEYQSKGLAKVLTPSQMSHQVNLERELTALEFAMQKLSRNHVFIYDDQKAKKEAIEEMQEPVYIFVSFLLRIEIFLSPPFRVLRLFDALGSSSVCKLFMPRWGAGPSRSHKLLLQWKLSAGLREKCATEDWFQETLLMYFFQTSLVDGRMGTRTRKLWGIKILAMRELRHPTCPSPDDTTKEGPPPRSSRKSLSDRTLIAFCYSSKFLLWCIRPTQRMPLNFPASRILTDECPRREYKPSECSTANAVVRKGLHFGQRKLLLSEVEFLSSIFEERGGDQRPLLVVYAGAANGQHLPFLFQLFPSVKFVLIDPAPFCKPVQEIAKGKSGPVVEIIAGYCTDELCQRLRETYHAEYELLLVSDIRSGVPVKMTRNVEHTVMMQRDNDLQKGWCTVLETPWAMLKFHPPYPAERNPASPRYDAEDDTPESIEYLDGTALFGVWAPKSSSEVRLVVSGPFQTPAVRSYNCRTHEEQCYEYNCSNRYQKDCDAERCIWERFVALPVLREPQVPRSASELSAAASKALGHPLFTPLSPDFTEAHARWYTHLITVKGLEPGELTTLYNEWKNEMTMERVEELVRQYSDASTIPADASVNAKVLTEDFWAVFCRGNLEESYTISRVRWQFFRHLPRLGDGEAKRRGPPRQKRGRSSGGKRL
eukprot:gene4335-3149_t